MSVRKKKCPRCGGNASSAAGHDAVHGVHALHHGISHGSPVMIGLGLLASAVGGIKHFRLKCEKCGNSFFGW